VSVLPETDLGVGEDVTVLDGPFRGFSGRVVEREGGSRFVIRVTFLNRGVSVPLDGWQLGRAGG